MEATPHWLGRLYPRLDCTLIISLRFNTAFISGREEDKVSCIYHGMWSEMIVVDTTFSLATCQWLSHLLILIVSRTYSRVIRLAAPGAHFTLYVKHRW
jgi:hypothetical protein